MSEIRQLLAAAQNAEIRGDHPEATRLLQEAARWYSARDLGHRAEQMLRHAARLGPPLHQRAADDFGFGDALMEVPVPVPERHGSAASSFEPPLVEASAALASEAPSSLLADRGPSPADPTVDAWCSFCCRPGREVGPLITGPTGAFVCGACVSTGARLLSRTSAEEPGRGSAPRGEPLAPGRARRRLTSLLPGQREVLDRLSRHRARVVLLIGPEGSGKSALLAELGEIARAPFTNLAEGQAAVELPARLTSEEEGRLVAWVEGAPARRLILCARGALPPPSLVLPSAQGEEAVYDTRSLAAAVGGLSLGLLSRVDQVLTLPTPGSDALERLALFLLEERGVELAEATRRRLIELALESGRGAHELCELVGRIPPGRYGS